MIYNSDEFPQEFGDEYVEHEEYSFLEEMTEWDERFFHWDEYNQEFYGELREKESEEAEEETQEPSESQRSGPSLLHKVTKSIKILAMTAAFGMVVAVSPMEIGVFAKPVEVVEAEPKKTEPVEELATPELPVEEVPEETVAPPKEQEPVKPEVKPEPKPEPKPEAKPEAKPEPESKPEPEVHEHVISDGWQVTDAATCSAPGQQVRICVTCNTVLESESIPELPHEAGDWVVDSAGTCSENGSRHVSCVYCGSVLGSEEITVAHTPVADPAVAATCASTGLTDGSHCSVCGTVLAEQKTIPALAHTPVTDTGKPADCWTTGLSDGSHCAVCGTVIVAQQEIPITHSLVTEPGQEPTCTEAGWTESSYCGICQTPFVRAEIIEALGHNYVPDDTGTVTCTRCGGHM